MKNLTKTIAGLLTLTAAPIGCSGEALDEGTATATSSVVVGADDRYDVYAHPDAGLRALATESTVALVTKDRIDASDPNDVQFAANEYWDLCSDERFHDQNQPAVCSGTLIADDLVLTAGHCVSPFACEDLSFVFGFQQASATQLATITTNDVYDCAEVIVEHTPEEYSAFDYAVVRLDRPVSSGRVPAVVQTNVELPQPLTSVMTIGHPLGLPAKIADNAQIFGLDGYRAFWPDLDAHRGNSGSGVFDDQQNVIGVVTSGAEDDPYYDEQGDCWRYGTQAQGGAVGVSYPFYAIRAMCQEIDHDLCGAENPVCGDGTCEPRESHASCAADCPDLPELPGVNVDLVINSEWESGYCAAVTVTNPSSEPRTWEVDLRLGFSTLQNHWSANLTADGSLLQFTPPAWASPLAAGASQEFGLCATKTAPQGTVVVEAVR